LFLAFFAVTLNMIFIPKYGINGAAIATLISITLYSIAKLLFVVLRMKLFPFTYKTLISFVVLIVLFFMFYFWEFSFHPIINIILKSTLVTIIYVILNYKLKLSLDFNNVVNSILKRVL